MVLDGVVNKESGSRLVRHIDWSVILLFCGLFVWLGGFKKTNLPKAVFLELKGFMSINSVLGVLVFTPLSVPICSAMSQWCFSLLTTSGVSLESRAMVLTLSPVCC